MWITAKVIWTLSSLRRYNKSLLSIRLNLSRSSMCVCLLATWTLRRNRKQYKKYSARKVWAKTWQTRISEFAYGFYCTGAEVQFEFSKWVLILEWEKVRGTLFPRFGVKSALCQIEWASIATLLISRGFSFYYTQESCFTFSFFTLPQEKVKVLNESLCKNNLEDHQLSVSMIPRTKKLVRVKQKLC